MSGEPQNSKQPLETVAAKALAGASLDEKALEKLIQAVIHGSGNRRQVEAVTGGKVSFDMVIFDTDRIGGFIFDSSRPPVIRGGSKILNDLNRDIETKNPYATVFSGGGEGLLLLPAGKGAAKCDEIEKMFVQRSEGALSVTTAVLTVKPEDMLNDPTPLQKSDEDVRLLSGTRAVLTRLRDRVRRNKERVSVQTVPESTPRRCVSCRDRAGTQDCRHWRPDANMPLFLCRPCVARWEVGKRLTAGVSFQDLMDEWRECNPKQVKNNYLGFLYTDGNAMGRFFAGLASLSELRLVSGLVKKAFDVSSSKVSALAQSYKFEQNLILDVLGGGDEKIWILPASLALKVCRQLPGWLDEALAHEPEWTKYFKKKGMDRTGITTGTGLVICDCKYPVQYQYALAKALQQNAKKRYYRGEENSFVDFAVISDASPLAEDLEDARELAYASADARFRLSLRPYSHGELEELCEKLAGVTHSQVYALRDAAREGADVFANFVCYQAARLEKSYQQWLEPLGPGWYRQENILSFFIDATPGRSVPGTWLGDGVELMPFLEKR